MIQDRQNPDFWDEFEWEQALRDSDDYARRYFQLLERFSDLPAANELITAYLGRGAGDDDCSFDCDQCEERWSCDLSLANEWNTAADNEWDEEEDGEDDDDEEGGTDFERGDEGPVEPGDTYFYESDNRFKLLRQVALGWCNVYAAILPPESRRIGIKALFHLGRALGNLSYSIGDGLYEHPAASVAFAKRALGHLNAALGAMHQLTSEKARLAPLLGAMRQHVFKSRSAVFDHLQECRRRCREDGGKAED